MLATGTRPGFDERAGTVRVPAAVSTSPTVKAIAAVAVSSRVVWSVMLEIVGGSLTAVTLRTNTLSAVAAPSLTVRVIVALPNWLSAGVIVAVRLASVPANTMLATGTRPGLDEV